MNLLRKFVSSPNYYLDKVVRKMVRILPNQLYLKWLFRLNVGYKLDLKHPKSFNAKLQWLKLNDHKPIYIDLVDKYEVKNILAKKYGQDIIIPTVGVFDTFDQINKDNLPDKFVMKVTHSSGGVLICHDKASFDWDKAKEVIEKKLQSNLYYWGLEWPYKKCRPRIIIEQYIEHPSGDLKDYKLMCFNGEVKCSFICAERFTGKGLSLCFFDKEWNRLPFTRSHPMCEEDVAKPINYNKMVELSEDICKSFDIPFARVDFYEVEGQVYFGEVTLFPGCGFEAFQPEKWDFKLGSWLKLPID